MKREHLTILLVDDDRNDLLFIEHAFREAGVTDPIQKVSSGHEAIAYLEGRGQFADRSRFEFPCFIMSKPPDHGSLKELLQKFHAFWVMVHVPRIDAEGEMLPTHAKGKIGERFEHHA